MDWPYCIDDPDHFSWRSKVIWGHKRRITLRDLALGLWIVDILFIFACRWGYWVGDPNCFKWRAKVILGHKITKGQNLINMISQVG